MDIMNEEAPCRRLVDCKSDQIKEYGACNISERIHEFL